MALGLVTLNTGCFKMAVPEDRPLPVILWPLPPDIPRVSFVNSLSRPEDMGIVEGAEEFSAFSGRQGGKRLCQPHGLEVDAEETLYSGSISQKNPRL
jgi:hypothetical protein